MQKSDFTPAANHSYPIEVLLEAWNIVKHDLCLSDYCRPQKGGLISSKVLRAARSKCRDPKHIKMWSEAEMGNFDLFYQIYPNVEEYIVDGEKIIV